MSKGHRSQIKKSRNRENKDTRPQAHLKFVRISDTKARFVLNEIKGKSAQLALAILNYSPRYASSVIAKVLKSAVANAENNLGMNVNDLYVQEVFANRGPILKRIRPRAKGRAYGIQKRTCHISIILNEKKIVDGKIGG